MENQYKCIDCFSGAGGLCLGLIKAGFDVLYSFDIDANSIASINANPLYFKGHRAEVQDINNINPHELLQSFDLKPGELDLLAGGPPCQGFSVQRIGSDYDARNHLVEEYISKVIAIRPKMFILENVPGIEGKRGRDILHRALKQVEDIGYYIHEQILDAQDYGVPQRRRRVVIVGERRDLNTSMEGLSAQPKSASVFSTTVICSSKSGCEISTTCTSISASRTSSRVLLKLSTKSDGNFLMNPTVSANRNGRLSIVILRTVVSSVAKSLFSAKTSLFANRFIIVLLPTLV